ncbi:MAG: toxic anion resistance protein [Oligoflexia bacterium]|nr:toxic anion resistance protein [Oligoflexia bacterium]
MNRQIRDFPEALQSQALDAEDQVRVETLKESIDIKSPDAALDYGVAVQKGISEFADGVLELVRNKDSGQVGVLLSDLMTKVKAIDVDNLRYRKPGILEKVFGGLINKARELVSKYEKINGQIAGIQERLGAAQEELKQDIGLMDGLFDRNVAFFKDLTVYIAAGDQKLKELRESVLPELQKKAESSPNPLDRQEFADFQQQLQRFERRVHDLKLSRTITLQALPQIRLIQHNNQQLAEKIQSSIVNTIPLWKNQILVALSLYRQRAALDLQKNVSDTTNELLQKNAELLKANAIEIARENERGIVDIATLRKTQVDLIETIHQTLAIQEEARKTRAFVEKELVSMEQELKTRLTEKPR